MQTIGERLEDARKKKGISIREAAEATKIRGDYLQKFESNHFDIGLSEIYTRGFLRGYATFLKLPSERILNDYVALGRGEVRPRQPNREIYGRMDITVASAGESSERAAPPEEPADEPAPARAQPRYPRAGGANLPSGPDPAVVFQYLKIGGGVLLLLVLILLVKSLWPSAKPQPPAATPPTTTRTPAATAPAPAPEHVATITALDIVIIHVWEKNLNPRNPNDIFGRELLPQTTLARGESRTLPKNGPLIVDVSAQQNIQIETGGKPPYNPADYGFRGKGTLEIK